MIYFHSDNNHLLSTIALYISENTVLYNDALCTYNLVKNYDIHVENRDTIMAWVYDIILRYRNHIEAELYKNLYPTLYNIVIGYLE